MRKASSTPTGPLSRLRGFQKVVRQGIACTVVRDHEIVLHQRQFDQSSNATLK